jgi:hypothetical protein
VSHNLKNLVYTLRANGDSDGFVEIAIGELADLYDQVDAGKRLYFSARAFIGANAIGAATMGAWDCLNRDTLNFERAAKIEQA